MALYKLHIDKRFYKDLKKIDKKQAVRIYAEVVKLEVKPNPPASKQLLNTSFRSLRVGDYRVLYEIREKIITVYVFRAIHRKDAYKAL